MSPTVQDRKSGTSQPRRSSTCHGQKAPCAPSHARRAAPKIPGDPGGGETEARREAAQPGQERVRLTSPGSALGGEEEQEAPEEEGEGTRPGKHRSPGASVPVPGVALPDVPVMSRGLCRGLRSRCRCPAVPRARLRCRAPRRTVRCPGVPEPGPPVPGDVGAGSAPVPGSGVSVPGGACARGCECPKVPEGAGGGGARGWRCRGCCRAAGAGARGCWCRCPAGLVSLRSKAPPLGRVEDLFVGIKGGDGSGRGHPQGGYFIF